MFFTQSPPATQWRGPVENWSGITSRFVEWDKLRGTRLRVGDTRRPTNHMAWLGPRSQARLSHPTTLATGG